MPRGLSGRILLAFAGLALAVLLAVGGTLVVVLTGLHRSSAQDNLANVSVALVIQRGRALSSQSATETLLATRDELARRDISAGLVTAGGQLVDLEGTALLAIGAPRLSPTGARGTTQKGTFTAPDGTRYDYAATMLRAPVGLGPRALVVATPDRARAQALGDLLTALPVVLLVLVLVGAPIAWLLSRSVSRPLHRLAAAAADLPASGTAPLPLQGPAEVRELTERFNAMSAALAETRDREEELLANLRHDLRTPLTVITGFAEALADGTATGEAAGRAARAIAEEAGRLDRLAGELGAIERLRSGAAGLRPENLEAGQLLRRTVERFAARATARGASLAVTAPAPGDPPLAFAADHLAVDRILANLVDNALAALPAEGGHVWLEARPMPPAPGYPAGVAFAVTDDGPGFLPGTIERVFERFFRADAARAGGGSGLGLAIVRELARAHGGEARAENVAPHGARVSVVLPVLPRQPAGTPAPGTTTAVEDAARRRARPSATG